MSMVCGLDLHREQITFDALVVESGESWRGRVWHPDRERFRRWLVQDVTRRAQGGAVALAVEGCTGWRYVVEEIAAAGFEAHVAETADTKAARSRKNRAKTDRTDARLLRELWRLGSCRSRGSRRPTCWSGGSECGCTSRWWISAPSGVSGSMPSCFNMACQCPRVRSVPRGSEHESPTRMSSSRRPLGNGSGSAIR